MQNNNLSKLSSTQDLTHGGRSYLREHGLSEREFDKMDPVSQREWKEECNIGAYDKSRTQYLRKPKKYF